MEFEDLDLKTEIMGWTVSTVKLSYDASFDDMPLWYETMVYREDSESLVGLKFQDYQARYTSIENAQDGHMVAVAKVLAADGGVI